MYENRFGTPRWQARMHSRKMLPQNVRYRPTRSRSRSPLPRIIVSDIIQFINDTKDGKMCLGDLRDRAYPRVSRNSKTGFVELWELLKCNDSNFVVEDRLKDVKSLSGSEIIEVKTDLSLCENHCRREKGGGNRKCMIDCKALHICRRFLLSESGCPFKSEENPCIFGHSFDTEHNNKLFAAHNLFSFHEAELRRLFRRRHSRCASTFPQVCIYYNKAEGNKCTNVHCRSLHICSDYVKAQCQGDCSRNHKLTTKQVQTVLEHFAIDESWTREIILDDIKSFMTPRHGIDIDTDGSENGDLEHRQQEDVAKKVASQARLLWNCNINNPKRAVNKCTECEDLKKEIAELKKTVQQLSEITEWKMKVEQLSDNMKYLKDKMNTEASRQEYGQETNQQAVTMRKRSSQPTSDVPRSSKRQMTQGSHHEPHVDARYFLEDGECSSEDESINNNQQEGGSMIVKKPKIHFN